MIANWSKLSEVNVLASQAEWAWPEAFRGIFRPRGVNLLVAETVNEFICIAEHRRIHAVIVDMDSRRCDGLAAIRILRMNYPLLPCILLASRASEPVLSSALHLNVFSVVRKPVDMDILLGLLNRLFVKRYNNNLFAKKRFS